jgi:hypothetical protein
MLHHQDLEAGRGRVAPAVAVGGLRHGPIPFGCVGPLCDEKGSAPGDSGKGGKKAPTVESVAEMLITRDNRIDNAHFYVISVL